MYVIPFWSYRHTEQGYIIMNQLTRQKRFFSDAAVNVLESSYAGEMTSPRAVDEDEILAAAKEMHILFDSEEQADLWRTELERQWFHEFPLIDQIELTNRCPYSCKMCPRTLAMDRALGNMPLDLFERIIKQVAGEQTYMGLHHFGESLVHPGLPDAVAIALEYGVRSGISCNPPSLSPKLSKRLLDAQIATMLFSFDSLDPDRYREIRGQAAKFEKGDANLREFIRLRDEGDYATFTTLQMISMHRNEGETDRFLDYCRDVGVDYGVIIRLGRWDFDDSYVQQLGDYTSPGYTGYCSRPWSSVVVLWNGLVVPCCHDYNGQVVLGDLKEQSLSNIWRSTKAKQFRLDNYVSPLCQQCGYSRWYREKQRGKEGFRRFHEERGSQGSRKEWINPRSTERLNGRKLFDGFDVLTD